VLFVLFVLFVFIPTQSAANTQAALVREAAELAAEQVFGD
jgi:hypothetical protein